jgi:hypothetical protein
MSIDVTGLPEEIEAILKRRGAADRVQLLLGVMDEAKDENGEYIGAAVYTVTNSRCGTCCGLIINTVTTEIIEGVTNGELTCHAVPPLFANKALAN